MRALVTQTPLLVYIAYINTQTHISRPALTAHKHTTCVFLTPERLVSLVNKVVLQTVLRDTRAWSTRFVVHSRNYSSKVIFIWKYETHILSYYIILKGAIINTLKRCIYLTEIHTVAEFQSEAFWGWWLFKRVLFTVALQFLSLLIYCDC